MKRNPKVSIIIPVYNGSEYVKEAIESALNQTYKNIEIIVVNDGSNDNGKTDKIVKKYIDKIKYFKKENGGVSTALNLGIKQMTGDYFSWLSHDDRYYPNKIELQIKEIKKYDENTILYSNYDLMDANSQIFAQSIFEHQELIDKPEYALLLGKINGITLLIPKKAFDDYGLFDEKLRCTQDYELWLKFLKKYKFVHMEEIIATTRLHARQTTNTSPLMISEGNACWKKIVEFPTKKRREKLEGSEYNYYKKLFSFLIDTPYNEATEYVKSKMLSLDKNAKNDIKNITEIHKPVESNIKKNNRIVRYFNIIKSKGIVYCIKRVVKRTFKLDK